MKDTIINWNEAHEESRRLTKVHGRDVEPKAINCDCDYSKQCFYCGGEGLYYQLVFSSCGHAVQDNDDECVEADCEHREYVAAIEREEELEVV